MKHTWTREDHLKAAIHTIECRSTIPVDVWAEAVEKVYKTPMLSNNLNAVGELVARYGYDLVEQALQLTR